MSAYPKKGWSFCFGPLVVLGIIGLMTGDFLMFLVVVAVLTVSWWAIQSASRAMTSKVKQAWQKRGEVSHRAQRDQELARKVEQELHDRDVKHQAVERYRKRHPA